MSYQKEDYNNITLNGRMNNMVFGVYEDESVAVCEQKDAEQALESTEDFVFNLSPTQKSISSTADLDKMIADYMFE